MAMEQTTSDRKADTGPLPQLPGTPSVPPNRPRSSWWPLALGAGLVAAVVVGVAVFFVLRGSLGSDERPIETVRGFVTALEARDANAMLSFVEPTVLKRQLGPEIRAYVEYIKEMRFEQARYELISNDGERAFVRMTATMAYTIDYGDVHSGQKPIDTTYELRLVEGAWYLSGVSLPAT